MKKITNIKGAKLISKKTQKQINGGFYDRYFCRFESIICYLEGPGAYCGDGVCIDNLICQEC